MRYIREYRTISGGEYFYEYVVTGACSGIDPSTFNMISSSDGTIPVGQTNFLELWDYVNKCEMEIEIETRFEYQRRVRSTKGIFRLTISGIAESDAALLALKFSDEIHH